MMGDCSGALGRAGRRGGSTLHATTDARLGALLRAFNTD